MSISGLRKASWYNPDTGTVVQANDLAEDGEFYTRAIEDPDDQTATGEAPYAGDESYCELMIFDMSLLPQLKAWKENDVRVSMVAAGVQQNIQWYERDLLYKVKPVYPVAAGRRNHINVVMQRTGHGAHDIYGNVNLLAHLGWADEDNDDLADGYELQDGMSAKNFGTDGNGNEDVQSVETGEKFAEMYAPLIFPVSNLRLTLSVEITQLHNDGEQQLAIQQLDYNGGNTTIKDGPYTSKGRKSLEVDIDSFAYTLLNFILATGGAVGSLDDIHGRYPAIRVDGSDQYVSY